MSPAHPALASWVRRARKLARQYRRRLLGLERRVVRLRPRRDPLGRVLFSYIVDPFLLPPGASIPYAHTQDWESWRMATTYVDLGYEVDVIHWTNDRFVPERGEYALLLDVRHSLERLAPLVDPRCVKLLHIETAHFRFHNQAQETRLSELEQRRGIRLAPRRTVAANRAIETADLATILGNRFTSSTYAHAGKPLLRVHISTPFLDPWPQAKDFARARRRFVWFGSGGLVHKGLDVVLDVFAAAPHLELVVCGPVEAERDFVRAYRKELFGTPSIRCLGWIDVGDPRFLAVAEGCGALVYPSCSEGGGGSVITCMHAGLVPLVSEQASVDVEGFGEVLPEISVEAVRAAAEWLASRPAEHLRDRARAAWEHARAFHTRERFAAEYREAALRALRFAADP